MTDTSISLLLVDVVIAVASLEVIALAAWHVVSGRGPAIFDLLAHLAAGLCLLGALRVVLAGYGWTSCALWLALAGAAHATDMLRHWPGRPLTTSSAAQVCAAPSPTTH